MSMVEELYGGNLEGYAKRKDKLLKAFRYHFNEDADSIFSSCGRVELLGNHTDHNHGKALVASIDMDILAAANASDEPMIQFISEGYDPMNISLDDLEMKEKEKGTSSSLIRGVLKGFQDHGYKIGGLKVKSSSNIWRGAGISSSAAFELLICELLNYYYNDNALNMVELAKIGQFAESAYFGKPCGLLDQLGVALGGVNYIDFADVENPRIEGIQTHIDGYQMILVNTGGNHSELTSHYAQIKEDMLQVATLFNQPYLNKVDSKEFIKRIPYVYRKLGGRAVLRGMHFFDENKRVLYAFNSLRNGNISGFLDAVNRSGESSYKYLQNCYVPGESQQSIPLGLTLTRKLLKSGAFRVHGGGFAGTILTFVPFDQVKSFFELMHALYGENSAFRVMIRNHGTVQVEKL